MAPSQTSQREPSSAARILFVSDERGWPIRSGYRRRTAQIVSALSAIGPVTWILAPRNRFDDGQSVEVPADLADSISPTLVSAPTRTKIDTAIRWLRTDLPWPLAAGDWSAVVDELENHHRRWELIWCMGLDAMAAVEQAGLQAGVTIVDADLESLKLHRKLTSGRSGSVLQRTIARRDVNRWQRLEQRAASDVTFSLCSDVERAIVGGDAFVTNNSYELVSQAIGSSPSGQRTDLLFVGSLSYEPNRDGLVWFVEHVLPQIRRRRLEVRLRVVGAGLDDDDPLVTADGVEAVGPVGEIGAELAAAAAVVVPLLWGAGTRIKILEAFAFGVPVVSTTLGAEGLGLASGQELLIADEPAAFADSCLALLTQPDLAETIVERAHETFVARYEESVVKHRLTDHVRGLLAAADGSHGSTGSADTAR